MALLNELSNETLENVRSIVNENTKNLHVKYFSFLSGSAAEGLATRKSDFDVYVVFIEDSIKESTEIFVPSPFGKIEITFLNYIDILAIFEKLKIRFEAKESQVNSYDIHIAHRIATGIPLENAEEFSSLRQSLNIGNLSRYLADYALSYAEKSFSDSIGNLDAHDEDTAVFNATCAVNYAMDHLLAENGNTSSLVKWRIRHAKRILGNSNPVFLRYVELTTGNSGGSDRQKRAFVESAARFLQAISDQTLASRFFPTMSFSLGESRLWGQDVMSKRTPSITKRACTRVVVTKGKLFLLDYDPMFEISQDVLAVWLAIDNLRTQSEIIEFLTANSPTELDLSAELICSHLEQFRGNFLIN